MHKRLLTGPRILGVLILVALALQFGLAVIAEASLSYLGLGTPPPNASWGQLLQQAQSPRLLLAQQLRQPELLQLHRQPLRYRCGRSAGRQRQCCHRRR